MNGLGIATPSLSRIGGFDLLICFYEITCVFFFSKHVACVDLAISRVMYRDGWTSRPPHKSQFVKRHYPAQYVIYTHTAETAVCTDTNECCSRLRNIQDLHMDRNSQYSFLAYELLYKTN